MASTSTTLPDLSTILTPELFTAIATLWNPFDPKTYPLPTTPQSYNAPSSAWHQTCFPALLALASHPLPSIPPLITFLPSPTAPDFPIQALGLTQLLDQAPRRLCKGIDERYVCGFFAPLSIALNTSLQSLPAHLRPDSKERWMDPDGLGASYEYWTLVYRWFSVPWIHSDVLEHQELARERNAFLRADVEGWFGVRDPWREREGEVRGDTKAFARVARQGPPVGVGMAEYTFWYCMLLDVHYPIIEKFGRYPYRCSQLGIEETEEEKKWLEETEYFGAVRDPVVKKKIREDVEKGVWTPLGAGLGYKALAWNA